MIRINNEVIVGDLEELDPIYANTSSMELSEWDLRILFGQIDQFVKSGEGVVDWKASVRMPWAQAKVLSMFLQVNIAIYEHLNGRITISDGSLPGAGPEKEEALPPDILALYKTLREGLLRDKR